MKSPNTYPLDIFMLKYGYASASNMNHILLRKVHNLFTLVLCIHFTSFISQGKQRIIISFSSIPYHLDFSVFYWFQTNIDEFHHELFILLQELLYPIIFMIFVALALRDIT